MVEADRYHVYEHLYEHEEPGDYIDDECSDEACTRTHVYVLTEGEYDLLLMSSLH